MARVLLLGSEADDAVIAHAQMQAPLEACGLLIGWRESDGLIIVDEAIAVANVSPVPERQFLIDPVLHLKIQRQLRGTARAIVGCYHAHPNGPAKPSCEDVMGAGEAGEIWLIAGQSQSREQFELAAFEVVQGVEQGDVASFRPLSLMLGGGERLAKTQALIARGG